MGPEAKLYKKIKKATPTISWNRIENLSHFLACQIPSGIQQNIIQFFTVEFKTTKANKIKMSPHQVAWHMRHPYNSFILAESLGSGCLKLYEGAVVRELVACGLTLEACASELDACCLKLETLGQ
jgi:hypothetical protein